MIGVSLYCTLMALVWGAKAVGENLTGRDDRLSFLLTMLLSVVASACLNWGLS